MELPASAHQSRETVMQRVRFSFALAIALAACSIAARQDAEARETPPPLLATAAGGPGFRVRADFSAPLNADTGWAAGLNEDATVAVDRPFRLRFEVEPIEPVARPGGLRLEYRRNGGEWAPVEAHDFPYPLREAEVDFSAALPCVMPEGWLTIARESATDPGALRTALSSQHDPRRTRATVIASCSESCGATAARLLDRLGLPDEYRTV